MDRAAFLRRSAPLLDWAGEMIGAACDLRDSWERNGKALPPDVHGAIDGICDAIEEVANVSEHGADGGTMPEWRLAALWNRCHANAQALLPWIRKHVPSQ